MCHILFRIVVEWYRIVEHFGGFLVYRGHSAVSEILGPIVERLFGSRSTVQVLYSM